MVQTEFGRSVAFTMRSFRFTSTGTSTGTSGDNNDQQQNISCDIKLIPSASLEKPRKEQFHQYQPTRDEYCTYHQMPLKCPQIFPPVFNRYRAQIQLTYFINQSWLNSPPWDFDFYTAIFYAQMPDCDCYTQDECIAQRNDYTPGLCGDPTSDWYWPSGTPSDCDGGKNMCHYMNTGFPGQEGVCENCGNLRSAKDCQDRVKHLNAFKKIKRLQDFKDYLFRELISAGKLILG